VVTILKDVPIAGIEVIPCRINGPRGIVKSFLVYDEEALVAVDTGFSDADTDVIAERIAKIGRTPADVTMCVITHRHGDHVGGLKKLRTLGDFAVVSHERDSAGITQQTGVKVDRLVAEGDSLPVLGGVRVLFTPGHTLGHIALYVERVQALICGDAIVSAGEHLMVSPTYLSEDPDLATQSVRKLIDMNLPVEHVLVGHGDDVYGGASANLNRIFAGPRVL
jgi:glyoxylase-like metal-dependent hydrolase (beta-lactamase superfamily II)